jgi:hypothetical protein
VHGPQLWYCDIAMLIPVFCVVDVVRAVTELGTIRRDIPVVFV